MLSLFQLYKQLNRILHKDCEKNLLGDLQHSHLACMGRLAISLQGSCRNHRGARDSGEGPNLSSQLLSETEPLQYS